MPSDATAAGSHANTSASPTQRAMREKPDRSQPVGDMVVEACFIDLPAWRSRLRPRGIPPVCGRNATGEATKLNLPLISRTCHSPQAVLRNATPLFFKDLDRQCLEKHPRRQGHAANK